jgi:lysozyme
MPAANHSAVAALQSATISAAGLTLIRAFESCRLQAYLPTTHDVPTIGWGATCCADGAPVHLGMVWSQAQADARLAADITRFARHVDDLITGVATQWFEFDALVSLAYNIGLGAFGESTLLRLHRDGSTAATAAQFGRWNRQAGTVLAGLTRRRAAEAAHYRGTIFGRLA